MLHGEGGANNFCFSAVVNAGGCGKVIRSSREAGIECSSHLKCRCVTFLSSKVPFLLSTSSQDTSPEIPSLLFAFDQLQTQMEASSIQPLVLRQAPFLTGYIRVISFLHFLTLLPFSFHFNPDSCCCLSPYSILSPSEELSTVVDSSSLHSLLLR